MPTPDVTLVGLYPPGGERHGGISGVASYTANLAHALSGAGASVSVVAAREPDEPTTALDGDVHIERHFDRGRRALPDAVAAAAATGAGVVHVQHELFLYGGPAALPALVPALRKRPRPTVLTLHQVVDPTTVDGSFTEMHRVRAPAVVARFGITGVQEVVRRLADAVIVHEPQFSDHVEGARVIPHGVEMPRTPDRASARAGLGIAADRFTVMCFGFIAPYKGLERSLEAASLADGAVDLVVAGGDHPRLAGRDPYADDLRSRWGHVARFVGRVPDDQVATWFAAADLALYLYPKPFSSSGALALALAHGTPFLVSHELGSCAGIPDELCVDRDPAVVAERLVQLASQRNELAAVGAAATHVSGERSWPRVAQRHLALYEEVSHARRRARRGVRAA